MGLSQILNRLPRTKTLPKFNFLSQSRPLRILACSILAITSRNFIENQLLYAEDSSGYSSFSFCNPTLLLGIPITSFHTSIHGNLAEAQVPLEADEDDNHSATPVANQATKEAEKICRLLSNHPTNSGYESALDNCGVEVSPILVLEVLKKLSNAGVLALSFFRWAEKQKWFKYSTESYNALIEALGKIKQFKMIDSLVISMKSKGLLTKDTFMLIMRRYARARKVKEAIQTFERMESFGLKPDSSDFNRFLDTLSKSRQVKHAQQMFDKMKKRRFAPDVKSYAILLEGWGQEQNLLKLDEVYREMKYEGFEPDAVTYGIIINAYCKARKVNEAVQKFQEMVANKCKPTPHIYCTLITGLGSEKRLPEALKFFDMLKASGVPPEAPTYNSVVGSYCCSSKFDDAFRIVDEMRRSRVGPNCRTYDIILHHLIKAQRTKEAYSVFQRMSKEQGCEPAVSTYEIIVRMFCKEDRLDMAMKVWGQMKGQGVLPGMHMFSTLINSLCHENKLEDACKFFQEMMDMGIRPPGPMFSNLKQVLVEGGKKDTALVFAQKLDKLRKTPICG